MLHDLGCIELVETEPRRGALEHYYRAVVRPFFSDRDWKRLPQNARNSISDAVFQLIWDDAAAAIKDGSMEEREDHHLSRTVLAVDEKGWEDLHDLLAQTLERAMDIQAQSASRASKADGETFCANLVMFTHPTPSTAKQTTAPSSGTSKKRRGGKKTTAKA
jgi:hypothetical protein